MHRLNTKWRIEQQQQQNEVNEEKKKHAKYTHTENTKKPCESLNTLKCQNERIKESEKIPDNIQWTCWTNESLPTQMKIRTREWVVGFICSCSTNPLRLRVIVLSVCVWMKGRTEKNKCSERAWKRLANEFKSQF